MDPIWIAVTAAAAAAAAALYCALRLRQRTHQLNRTRAERDEARSQHGQSELQSATLKAQLDERTRQLEQAHAAHDVTLSRHERARQELEHTKTELAAEKADHRARSEELAKAREQIDTHFKSIAADVVNTSADAFLKHAGEQFDNQRKLNDSDLQKRQQAIDSIVKPVGETLHRFQQQVGELETKREGAYQSLGAQVSQLYQETVSLRDVAGNLSEAMKSSYVRGKWGEQQLERVLELSGLKKGINYYMQHTLRIDDDKGTTKTRRPDAVVRLPNDIDVVIDSKVPMSSYLDASNIKVRTHHDAKHRDDLLAKHAKSLLGHARSLGTKKYTSGLPVSPDFVVMFVPSDPILDVAMHTNPKLWETAWKEHKVLIATPGLLLALLRTVALIWRRQYLEENAQEISEQAKKLYDGLRALLKNVALLGKHIQSTGKAYDTSVELLQGKLLPPVRKLEDLGASESLTDKVSEKDLKQIDYTPRSLDVKELSGS